MERADCPAFLLVGLLSPVTGKPRQSLGSVQEIAIYVYVIYVMIGSLACGIVRSK